MNEESLTSWDLDVPRPQGQSISNANLRGSSRSTSLMASSTTPSSTTPDTTPTEQADRVINHSPSSSTGRGSRPMDSSWNKKYVLTLDGGGVRGLSSLSIIQHLMDLCNSFEQKEDPLVKSSFHPLPFQEGQGSNIKNESRTAQFLPVHYFDYIAGTSTGGLIAIYVEPTTNEHRRLYSRIRNIGGKSLWSTTQVFDARPYTQSEIIAPLMLLISFRTYEHTKSQATNPQELNPGHPQSIPIWQVARAITAAPTYFKSFRLGEEKFIDGDFGYNNPTRRAILEIEQVHGEDTIALVVSIGTGRRLKVRSIARHGCGLTGVANHFSQMIKYTTASTTDTESTHQYVMALLAARKCPYKRFNVDGELGDMDLGEWRTDGAKNVTLETIKQQTRAYLEQPKVRKHMEEAAIKLVINRQMRSKTPRWDVVATGYRYQCPEQCNKEIIYTKEYLGDHLCEVHGIPRDADEGRELERASHLQMSTPYNSASNSSTLLGYGIQDIQQQKQIPTSSRKKSGSASQKNLST
ncbi:hypothetical protein SBOR_4372 [Sclerotinia borealis F-4128]|uniref:PNPLA domain-containing protein n=1 Tax=Sclerotinia borealis (strain F-4128) TaxID=1432307 RepID=W9CL77_SCLBF|nr:hypothetical protein SBOR_4372 [Sclerotinia borealis F-4128]